MRKFLNVIVCELFVVICFFVIYENAVFADDPTGAASWTVQLFAGPGKGDEVIGSITAADFITGTNKIYGIANRIVSEQGKMLPDAESWLYEFEWVPWPGNSWTRIKTQVGKTSVFDRPLGMNFCTARGDGVKRLYFGSPVGNVYEFSYNGYSWNNECELNNNVQGWSLFFGHLVKDNSIFKGSPKGDYNEYSQLEEWKWTGQSWALNYAQQISETVGRQVLSIAFGNGRGDGNNYMYARTNYGGILELKWTGSSWEQVSQINAICAGEIEGLSKPNIFIADVGTGIKLYCLSNGNVLECSWGGSNWRIRKISLGGSGDGPYFAVTCGKISWEATDPVAVYALVAKNIFLGAQGAVYSEENADEIHEYTYNKDKRKWQQTWTSKLFDSSIPQTKIEGWANTVEMCMINGRNEKVVVNGEQVDMYQRLYIIDSWGNMWECSIPPRKLRPDYQSQDVPVKKPTITGE